MGRGLRRYHKWSRQELNLQHLVPKTSASASWATRPSTRSCIYLSTDADDRIVLFFGLFINGASARSWPQVVQELLEIQRLIVLPRRRERLARRPFFVVGLAKQGN